MSEYIERYWRDATPQDAVKEPPMVARFRQNGGLNWRYHKLFNWDRTVPDKWINDEGYRYYFCQVYSPPDPGEGWRLIDTENEKPEWGDQYFDDETWIDRPPEILLFNRNFVYRREANKITYKPLKWQDCKKLQGRWIRTKDVGCETTMAITRICQRHGKLLINSISSQKLFKNWVFVDTGEPVARKVTQ